MTNSQPSQRVDSSLMRGIRQHSWIILVAGCYAIVYLFSLTLVYIEGDDAASIAYHAVGRRSDLVGPFIFYHSMMDTVLSLLPARETLLRPFSILATSVAAVVMVILMLALAFDWLGIQDPKRKLLTTFVILLAVPELFYLGLVYLPSVIAICFIIGAHMLLRRSLRKPVVNHDLEYWKRPGLLAAAVLYGFGAACRWDTGIYGIIITLDLLLGTPQGSTPVIQPARRRLFLVLSWGLVAVLAAFGAFAISGYGPRAVLELVTSTATSLQDTTDVTSYLIQLKIAGLLGSLFTPPYILLALAGLLSLFLRRLSLGVSLVVGILAVVTIVPWWPHDGAPKQIIAAIPLLLTCVVAGFQLLWYETQNGMLRNAIRLVLVMMLAGIWLVGIQVKNATAWGPDFELKPFDRPQDDTNTKFSIVPGAGLALPLTEGPRPFFGHAPVLLGGLWRAMAIQHASEQEHAVETAIELGIPELRIERQNPGIAVYAGLGFKVASRQEYGTLLNEWSFVDGSNRWGTMLALFDWNAIQTSHGLDQIRSIAGRNKVVVYGLPSEMHKLYWLEPDAFEKLGLSSSIVDLDRLYNSVATKQ